MLHKRLPPFMHATTMCVHVGVSEPKHQYLFDCSLQDLGEKSYGEPIVSLALDEHSSDIIPCAVRSASTFYWPNSRDEWPRLWHLLKSLRIMLSS